MTERQRLWIKSDRERMGFRRAMKPVFLSALNRQAAPIFELIGEATSIDNISLPVSVDIKPVEEAYRKLYLTVTPAMAISKRNKYKKSYNKGEAEVFNDLIHDRVMAYLRVHAGETVTATGDTTLETIRAILKRITPDVAEMGLSAGTAVSRLRDILQSEWHQAARFRVERIVRTEVNRAANFGALEGMQSLNMPMKKVWLSAFVEKSRPEHMDADGQEVGLNDPFEVGGEFLQYPGDPKGSAGNTINCLCSVYEKLI